MKSSLFFVPVALVGALSVAGCGGASAPVATARTDSATFALTAGQNATLSVQSQGNLVTGTLLVPATGNTTTRAVGSLSNDLPRGSYGFNGTLTSNGSFTAYGNVPLAAPFTLIGQLGAGANSGSFTLFLSSNINARVNGGLIRTG